MLKVNAEETTYAHSDTAESGNVVLNVEWNEPVLGQPLTFHVSATGGSGAGLYKLLFTGKQGHSKDQLPQGANAGDA